VFHDLGAFVVEDEEVVGGLDEIDGLAGEGAADVEPGLADLDDAVPGDRDTADSVLFRPSEHWGALTRNTPHTGVFGQSCGSLAPIFGRDFPLDSRLMCGRIRIMNTSQKLLGDLSGTGYCSELAPSTLYTFNSLLQSEDTS
jgi:hypothetical protein